MAITFPVISSAAYVDTAIGNIKSAFITVGSSIVVIGWIIAGILYLTAAGSPEKLGTAKKALFACVVGTALIILSVVAEMTISNLLMPGGPPA